MQPPRNELKAFHRDAELLLEQEVLWFDEKMRETIAFSFAATAMNFGYIIWTCAILRNHAHLVVQRHKHRHDVMWRTFAEGAAQSLRVIADVPERHRIWGERPYSVFLFNPDEVKGRIEYVDGNPTKEGLPPQTWEFVRKYPR